MKEVVMFLVAVSLLCAVVKPEKTGAAVHRLLNNLKTGWESVQQ